MPTTRKIYGYLVIKDMETLEEVHRVAVHSPENSRQTEKVEAGLVNRMDINRYFFAWEDA